MTDYRGYGGTLTGLGEFLQSLANVSDPDKAKRDALERRLLTDPDLAGRLQDDPQQLAQLVGDKNRFGANKAQELIDRVNKMKLTPQQMADKIRSKSIAAVANYNDQGNQNVATDTMNAVNGAAGTGVGVTPNMPNQTPLTAPTKDQQDTYNRSIGLPTTDEQAAQKLQLQHLTTQTNADQLDLDQKTTLRKNAAAARAYLAQNKLDPYTAFLRISTLPPEVQTGLTSDPDLQNAVKDGMTQAHFNMMYDLQKSNERHNIMLGARVESARSMSEKLGVPFDDVFALINDPQKLKQYKDNGFKPLAPDDRLAEVAQRIDNFSNHYSEEQIAKAKALFERQRAAYLKDGKKNPEQTVININNAAQNIFGGLGIEAPVYKYDQHKWNPFKSDNIILDSGGDERLKYRVPKASDGKNPEANVDVDVDATAKNVQAMLDDGQQSYQAAMQSTSLPAAVKAKLRPPKKK